MAAIRSLQPALRSLVRNPILLVVTGAVGILQLPQLLAPTTGPLLSTVISLGMSGVLLLFLPFYQGGILGMGDEARNGSTSIGTLIEVGKSNYVSLLLSYVVVLAIAVAFGIIVGLLTVVGGIGLIVGGGQSSPGFLAVSPAILAVGGIVSLLLVVGYLGTMVFIQFYGHEIVLNDAAVGEAFTGSIGLVRNNLLSTIGYSLIIFGGGGLIGAISAATSFLVAPQEPFQSFVPELSLPLVIGAAVVSLLATAVLGAFYATYSVTFYRELTGASRTRL